MARSRIIRPEFFDDEKLATISRDARYLFIGLWKCSDDYGVTKGHKLWIKSQVFPYDNDINENIMEKLLSELESIKVIEPFEANDEHYYNIPKFLNHQKIDHPSKTRNPAKPSRKNRERIARQSEIPRYETETETETELKQKQKLLPDKSEHKKFVEFYTKSYEKQFPGAVYGFDGGKDGALIKTMLKQFGYERLCQMTMRFFMCQDEFIRDKIGYTVAGLKLRANQLAREVSGNKTVLDTMSESGRQSAINALKWLENQ
jgi:hypothetical protein